MDVARWALIGCAVLWGLLCLVMIPSFLFSAFETFQVRFLDGIGSSLWHHTFITGWAYYVAPAILSYLAMRDLMEIPIHVRERFRLRYLGILGWIGVSLILAGFLCSWDSARLLWLPLHPIDDQLEFKVLTIVHTVEEATGSLWLGALCLYARYRIAANKRLAAASDH